MLRVQPVAREGFSGGRFALRDFVLVMREGEVDSAGVNVERFAEIFHGHRGAFDMPAGTARADGGLPEMFAGFRRLPECKIARAFLFVAVVVHARARLNARQIDLRQLAVIGKFGDAVVDRAFARIGESLLLEALDELAMSAVW